MRTFDIKKPNRDIEKSLQEKVDNLTKPKGSLGMLERLAVRIGMIQGTLNPSLNRPHNVLFAADHGIVAEGVTVSPKEVTHQQLMHFSRGGAGINFLCDQHGFKLILVDAGVDADVDYSKGIIDRKVRRGTDNFISGPAMSMEEFDECIRRGAEIVDEIYENGCNVVSFGEMGSGNTSPSAMWMSILTGMPIEDCTGAGAGLDSAGISHKTEILKKSYSNYSGGDSIKEQLAWFGGFEMVMAVGGMLSAAQHRMIILVDGFIMSACMLAAAHFYPEVMDYAIFCHIGDESGHKRLLEHLRATPILNLGLRLGEGSGAVCAYPIVDSAVRMINEMDSFKATEVTKYFD